MLKRTFLIILILCSVNAAANDYTIEDLRALRQQGGWEELLANAKAIKPTQRDSEWQALVTEAATNYLASQKPGAYSRYSAADLTTEYPFLAGNTNLNTTANNAVISELQSCFTNTDATWGYNSCLENYKYSATHDNISPETAMEAARIISGKIWKNQQAPYYEIVVKPSGNDYCNDADLQSAILEGLVAPSYSDIAISARNVAYQLCKTQFIPVVQTAKAKETANYTQRTRHFMQNYCVFNAAEPDCVKGDF